DGRGRCLRPAGGGAGGGVQPQLFRRPSVRVGPRGDEGDAEGVRRPLMLPAQMLVEARLPSHALENPGAETAGRLDAFLAGVDCSDKRIAACAGGARIAMTTAVGRSG